MKNAREFIEQHKFAFPMVRNGDRFSESDVGARCNVNVEWGLPVNLLLDAEGRVVYIHHRYQPGDEAGLAREIESIL